MAKGTATELVISSPLTRPTSSSESLVCRLCFFCCSFSDCPQVPHRVFPPALVSTHFWWQISSVSVSSGRAVYMKRWIFLFPDPHFWTPSLARKKIISEIIILNYFTIVNTTNQLFNLIKYFLSLNSAIMKNKFAKLYKIFFRTGLYSFIWSKYFNLVCKLPPLEHWDYLKNKFRHPSPNISLSIIYYQTLQRWNFIIKNML